MTFSRHVVTMEKVADYDASKQHEYAAAVAAHMVDNPVYDPEGTMDGTSYSINAGGGDASGSGSAATNGGSSKLVRPEDLFRQTSMNFSRFDTRVRWVSEFCSNVCDLLKTHFEPCPCGRVCPRIGPTASKCP